MSVLISGYASLFGVTDLVGDTVEAGAFSRSLCEYPICKIPILYQHMSNKIIGQWMSIIEDSKGLHVEGIIWDENVQTLIEREHIDMLSIGFRTIEFKKDKNGNRVLLDVDLREISVVRYGMCPGAQILEIKSV